MRVTWNSKTAPAFSVTGVLTCGLILAVWSAAAVYLCYSRGWLLYYGDAECHLDIARRMVDSQTPGYAQVGTVWLPLTHWAMLPFVRRADLWHNGLAGAIPFAFCFAVGGSFLFAAVRRIFQSTPAAITATALCALNPNLLYIQATPMTEAMFFGCLAALLYYTVRFRDTQAWWAVIGAGAALCLGTLTRYDGWFLIPFVGAYFLWTAKQRRFAVALVFCLLASLGPLFWLGHNWVLSGDPLAFYRGPYSARAIQGNAPYPGKGDWRVALKFFECAAFLCAGPGLVITAALGVLPALLRRAFWSLLLLLLPGIFYVCSMHSGGTPLFVPNLYYGAYYNVRYGLSVLPFLAVASAAIVAVAPPRMRTVFAVLAILAGVAHWAIDPQPRNWIVWQEGNKNYQATRELEHEVEDYLRPRYVPGSGIVTSFGATTAIYRELGIPLRETLTGDNGAVMDAASKQPNPFPHQAWAVVLAGDWAEKQVQHAGCYTLEQSFAVKGAPEIHIYRRTGGGNGSAS
jgi:Dolichyl-phosphate-mannose-protein mannosyltransferase